MPTTHRFALLLAGHLVLSLSSAPSVRAQELPTITPVELTAATAVLGFHLFDAYTREALRAPAAHLPISDVGDALGNGRIAVSALGLAWAVAEYADVDAVEHPVRDAIVGLAAAGAVNGITKMVVGRARPRLDEGARTFRPFNLSNAWQSFPSGHTVVGFSLATAVSEHYRHPLVRVPAYGLASLVAWSRVHEDEHWVSDVVAGALIGTYVTRSVVRWLHDNGSDGRISVILDGTGAGISISVGRPAL